MEDYIIDAVDFISEHGIEIALSIYGIACLAMLFFFYSLGKTPRNDDGDS